MTVVRSTFQKLSDRLFATDSSTSLQTFTFSQCTFWNNDGVSEGLLRVTKKATLVVESCLFENNVDSAAGRGACISAEATEEVSVRVLGSRFSNNRRPAGAAACISMDPPFGTPSSLEVQDSEFLGNRALGHGGAIFIGGTQSLRVARSVFANNSALFGVGDGGAVHIAGCEQGCVFDNCTFRGNQAEQGGALSFDRNVAFPWALKVRSAFFCVCLVGSD